MARPPRRRTAAAGRGATTSLLRPMLMLPMLLTGQLVVDVVLVEGIREDRGVARQALAGVAAGARVVGQAAHGIADYARAVLEAAHLQVVAVLLLLAVLLQLDLERQVRESA